jgi:sugar phosphate isomerase/epimerase
MLGELWRGTVDDILDIIAAAGYEGVEFSNSMIGRYWGQPDKFQNALERRGLTCAAFGYATTGFTDRYRFEDDLAGAQKALQFAAHFHIVLGLGGPSSLSRDDYETKFAQACRFYNEVAWRGKKMGVTVAVHPTTHHGSLVLTAEEYDRLLTATESAGLMFNPDTGHIVRSGQDLITSFLRHRDRIVHIHAKDVDAEGRWKLLGKGKCDFPMLVRWLEQVGYRGWIVAEDESDEARKDAAKAVAQNRKYLQSLGH